MSAAASIDATATLGHLALSASSIATDAGLTAGSEAYVSVAWGETVTASGPTQSDGRIHLQWSFDLNDSLSMSGNMLGLATIHTVLLGPSFLNIDLFDAYDAPYLGQRHFSGEIALVPGQSVFYYNTLAGDARSVQNDAGTAKSDVAALYSADFHLDKDPISGGSYTTSSGLSYFTPIPEPSTVLLAVVAIAGLVARTAWTRRPIRTDGHVIRLLSR